MAEGEVQDTIRLRGYLQMVVKRPDGSVKDCRAVNNLVMQNGRSWALAVVIPTSATGYPSGSAFWDDGFSVSAIFVGSSSQAPNVTDTFYGPVVGAQAIQPIACITSTLTANPPIISFTGSFNSGVNSFVLREAGLVALDPVYGAANFSRATFSPITCAITDTFAITYSVQG